MPGPSGAAADGKDGLAMSQLRTELQAFRSVLLKDMKCILQGALQEVLDKHQYLTDQHEENLRTMLSDRNRPQADLRPPARSNVRTKDARQLSIVFEGATGSDQSRGRAELPETPSAAPKPTSDTSSATSHPSEPIAIDFQERLTNDSHAAARSRRLTAKSHTSSGDIFAKTALMLKDNTDPAEIPYDVTMFYKSQGCVTKFVQSSMFNHATLFVILVNALYLGIDADNNPAEHMADADIGFQICEHAFCAFFTSELALRFAAFETKCNCLRDPWFVFDFFLVALMITETWLISMWIGIVAQSSDNFSTGPLGLLRLLRLARVTRLMRSLPELVTMVKGIIVALRAMFSALVLMVCLIYVFGIVLHSLLKKESHMHMYFATLPKCMWTLFLNGVFLDAVSDVVRLFIDRGAHVALVIFVAFVSISACTVMNMLIGVLCEIVSQVATAEHDNAARNKIRNTVLVMLRRLDKDGSGDISKPELLGILTDPEALSVLDDLQINVKYFLDLQNMLYETPQSVLSISTIMSCLMESRGDRQVTMADLVLSIQVSHHQFCVDLAAHEQRMAKQIQALVAQSV